MIPHSLKLSLLLSVIIIVSACGTETPPDVTVAIPTVAILPSDTPTPTTTHTPTNTPTRTLTPTPTITRTRPPTFTPAVEDITNECDTALQVALDALLFNCDGMEPGDVCYGSGLLDTIPAANVAITQPLPVAGSKTQLQVVDTLRTSTITETDAFWGTAVLWLIDDLNGPLPANERISVLALGGSRITNLTPPLPDIGDSDPTGLLATEVAALDIPYTTLQIEAEPLLGVCPFVPTGVFIQTSRPAQLAINGVEVTFDGTIHIMGTAGDVTDFTNLEGTLQLRYLDSRVIVPLGIAASVPMTADLLPASTDVIQNSYDARLDLGFFDAAQPVQTFLERQITAPPVTSPEEVFALNTLTGDWIVETRIGYISGVYEEGDTINDNLIADARQICNWQGGWLLGSPNTETFTIREERDGNLIGLRALYPDVTFPSLLLREETELDIYTRSVEDNGVQFDHTIIFETPLRFEWEVVITGLANGPCGEAIVRGTGTRDITALPVTSTPISGVRSDAWVLNIAPGSGYVPANDVIEDCPSFVGFAPVAASGQISTVQTSDGNLTVNGIIPNIPLPTTFTADPLQPGSYLGRSSDFNSRYDHVLRLVDNNLIQWQIMQRNITNNCREGIIIITGTPLGG